MTAYRRLSDILPCPRTPTGQHEWLDRRQCSSDEPYKAECSECAALLGKHWWGWDFRTGLEHFDDAKREPAIQALMREMQDNRRLRQAPLRIAPPVEPEVNLRLELNGPYIRLVPM